ncbi:MAG: hypothetical protein LBR16_05685 [Treponema sp.]|jgi:hypothetical protein|nr:hypothetical protein [Treponema sp.]
MKQKGLFILGALIIGMAFTLTGCGEKGGTVTLTNDTEEAITAIILVAAETPTTPSMSDYQTVAAGAKISKSLDEDGHYVVAGAYTEGLTSHVISKSGTLSGGESVDLKASDF